VKIVRKIDSIENQRMLTVVLAIIEYDFVIEYYPGVENVLADFGTRQLDPEEWAEEDEFEFADLFVSTPFDIITGLPINPISDYGAQDFAELQRFKLTQAAQDGVIKVYHLGDWLTFVPSKFEESSFLGLPLPKT